MEVVVAESDIDPMEVIGNISHTPSHPYDLNQTKLSWSQQLKTSLAESREENKW